MVNSCSFIGRLGKDPELKSSSTGGSFANFSLAVDKAVKKDKDEKPLWLNVTCFGKTADFVGQYLKKGALVYIQGELAIEEYTPKDSTEKKQYVKILAGQVRGLERKSDGATAPAATPAAATAAGTTDDDIPF